MIWLILLGNALPLETIANSCGIIEYGMILKYFVKMEMVLIIPPTNEVT